MHAVVPRTPRKPSIRHAQGARILKLRQAAGLSQVELAQALGVPQTTIAHWERSDKPPRSDVLPQMATALGVAVADLLADSDSSGESRQPVGRLQTVVAQIRRLPRRQQDRILDVIAALVQQQTTSEDEPIKRTRKRA